MATTDDSASPRKRPRRVGFQETGERYDCPWWIDTRRHVNEKRGKPSRTNRDALPTHQHGATNDSPNEDVPTAMVQDLWYTSLELQRMKQAAQFATGMMLQSAPPSSSSATTTQQQRYQPQNPYVTALQQAHYRANLVAQHETEQAVKQQERSHDKLDSSSQIFQTTEYAALCHQVQRGGVGRMGLEAKLLMQQPNKTAAILLLHDETENLARQLQRQTRGSMYFAAMLAQAHWLVKT